MKNITPPSATKHMQARMSQRGIPSDLVDLVLKFGENDDDRLILTRKALSGLLQELRTLQRSVLKAIDKGGIVVVETGGALITTYNFDSFDRRRAHAR